MQRVDRMRTKPLFAMMLWLFAVVQLTGENGRDFAGVYDVTNVSDLGETVQLTFSVRVFNYSGGDVTGGTLNLEDSIQPSTIYGSFYAVSITYRKNVRLTGNFTVAGSEFQRWRKGASPRLTFEFQNSEGQPQKRLVELSRRPLPEVN